jgi:glycosyltransferase involved in cell wall biosynthesis
VRIAMIAYTPYETDPRVKRAVTALVERGHSIDIFAAASDGIKPESDSEHLRIYRLRMRKRRTAVTRYAFEYSGFFAWAFILVTIFHVRRRYHVVYVHNLPNFLVFAGLIPKMTGAKVILDVHDPAAELLACIRGRELPWWLRYLTNAEERISLSFAAEIITVNESMRRRLSLITRLPVAVVMNVPDLAVFCRPETSSHTGGTQRLVYSGTIAHRFGLDLVVRALSMLATEFPLLRLQIVGEGPAVDSLLQLAEAEGVADRVDYVGFVPNHEIPAVVDGAVGGISAQREDVFGSLVFSMKVAEYVALGLPVVCARTTTMRYYFDDDEILFFEPEDTEDLVQAIRKLLSDPAAAAERAAKCGIKLDKLSWSAQKETLAEVVERPSRRTG